MRSSQKQTTKDETGEFARFDNLLRRVLSVPHSEIKKQLEAEKDAKKHPSSRAVSDKG